MRWQRYETVSSLGEALTLLAANPESARVVAGGTDLIVQIDRQRTTGPCEFLVDVCGIDDLRRIYVDGDRLVVGATATMAEVAESPVVREHARALADGAASVAAPQIRAVATVGGNLVNASPAADTATPLVALDAVAEIVESDGTREVPVAQVATGPGRACLSQGEILARVRVPLARESQGQAFAKLGRRQALSVSIVNAAALVSVQGSTILDARLVVGAVAPTVVLVRATESIVCGKEPDDAVWQKLEAAIREEVRPITDLRGSAAYRRDMAGVYGRRAVKSAYENALLAQARGR